MRIINPCKKCILRPICKDPCKKREEYREYIGCMKFFITIGLYMIIVCGVPSLLIFGVLDLFHMNEWSTNIRLTILIIICGICVLSWMKITQFIEARLDQF